MLYKEISKILALYLYGFCAAILVPFFLAGWYQFFVPPLLHPQPHSTGSFLATLLICFALGLGFHFFGRSATGQVYRKEGLAIVVLIWILTPAISALPFFLSGTLENPIAAFFESTSGLTTTGSTALVGKAYNAEGKEIPIQQVVRGVLDTSYTFYGTVEPVRDPLTHQVLYEGIEAVGKALLFWRSFIQWLGGGGIIVLFVAILPILGAGGRVLFQTEVPGPIKDTLTPRIKETAIQLWKIYLGLTLFEIVLLMVTNREIGLYDASTITFAALSTGGFSVHNANIGYYRSAATDWAVLVCMLLGSINFSLYYYVFKGKFYKIFKPELFLYIAIVLVASLFTIGSLYGAPKELLTHEAPSQYSLSDAIRYGTFHIVSAITTSGFITANYDVFPFLAQTVMLIVMFVGGMSGSTAGGIKIMRHYLLFRIGQNQVESLFRPKKVQVFKVGNKEVDRNAALTVLCFFLIIISVSVLGTLLYVVDGIDPKTALGLVGCMINDTGLSFRVAGPLGSCAFMSDFSYLLSCILMIMGRLEFFAVFAFLVPAFWKQNE
jgi:trk system potassium uptake protein TrkH